MPDRRTFPRDSAGVIIREDSEGNAELERPRRSPLEPCPKALPSSNTSHRPGGTFRSSCDATAGRSARTERRTPRMGHPRPHPSKMSWNPQSPSLPPHPHHVSTHTPFPAVSSPFPSVPLHGPHVSHYCVPMVLAARNAHRQRTRPLRTSSKRCTAQKLRACSLLPSDMIALRPCDGWQRFHAPLHLQSVAGVGGGSMCLCGCLSVYISCALAHVRVRTCI